MFAITLAAAMALSGQHPAAVDDALARGCHVQQVHTPAGKMVGTAPIVHCAEADAIADVAAPVASLQERDAGAARARR